ncbi:outer membrane family protein [Helicobacter cetorum]|uniref:outer membrane family protein n=1 Tax=Helicobacter cetorum TaxID=138563 RepID=UPI000CF0DDFD|nr:outer membrane family protein [Helicobacter cetorum]
MPKKFKKRKIASALLKRFTLPLLFTTSSLGAITYEVHGDFLMFSKVGFNHAAVNPIKGIYPQDTFVNIAFKLEGSVHLGRGWSVNLGGALGGQPYASTKQDRWAKDFTPPSYWLDGSQAVDACNSVVGFNGSEADLTNPMSTCISAKALMAQSGGPGSIIDPRGFQYMYMGEWNGSYPNYYPGSAYLPGHSRRYSIYKANLTYDSERWHAVAGRFDVTEQEQIDWMYQMLTGFYGTFKVNDKLKLQLLSSWGRGIVDGQWFFANYREKPWGIHKAGIIYRPTKNLMIHPYLYLIPEVGTLPGIKIEHDTNPNFASRGIRFKTTFYAMYDYRWNNSSYGRYAPARYNTWDPFLDGGKWRGLQGPGGATLLLREHIDINNYFVVGAAYLNIGNPNMNLGTWGNPIAIDGIEQWVGSVYGLGFASIDNITAADAFTEYVKGGGNHGKFSWSLYERFTTSPRAVEYGIGTYMDYQFSKHIKAGFKLVWLEFDVRAGYNPGTGFLGPNGQPLNLNNGLFETGAFVQGPQNMGGVAKSITQDRSHLMTHFSYSF